MNGIDIKDTFTIYLDVSIKTKEQRKCIVRQYPLELTESEMNQDCKIIMKKLREMGIIPEQKVKFTFFFKHIPQGTSDADAKSFSNDISLKANKINDGDCLQLTFLNMKMVGKPKSDNSDKSTSKSNLDIQSTDNNSKIKECADNSTSKQDMKDKVYFEALVFNTKIKAFIDTSMTKNIIYEDQLNQIGDQSKVELFTQSDKQKPGFEFIGTYKDLKISFEDKSIGTLKLNFTIAKGRSKHIIIGLESLQKMSCIINFGSKLLTLFLPSSSTNSNNKKNNDNIDNMDVIDGKSSKYSLKLHINDSPFDLPLSADINEINVAIITENGFEKELAIRALDEAQGNLDEALAFCYQSLEQ